MATIIKLSNEELSQYYLWPQDLYYCELGLNDQELSDDDENKFNEVILQTSDIPSKHHNFLKWTFASLKKIKSKQTRDQSGSYSEVVNASSELKGMNNLKISSVKVNGVTSENVSKTIFLPILDETISLEIMDIIESYIKKIKVPKEINGKRGRPQGTSSPGREELFSNLAFNLRVIIAPSENSAKLILFKFGVLLNYWKENYPEGKYENSQQYYQDKKVNKFFVNIHDLQQIALINPPAPPSEPSLPSLPIPDY